MLLSRALLLPVKGTLLDDQNVYGSPNWAPGATEAVAFVKFQAYETTLFLSN